MLIVVSFVVVGVGASGAYALLLARRIETFAVELPGSPKGGTTYLLVGSDSRAGIRPEQQPAFGLTPGERADIMLVVRAHDDGTITVVSLPRDLLVLGPELAFHRLALRWLAGPQALVESLCGSLGLGIDHLVVIDMVGFMEVVDAVGGVDVVRETALRDTLLDFDLDVGRTHLDGYTALQYVRARHLQERTIDGWKPIDNARSEHSMFVLRALGREMRPDWNVVRNHRLAWSVAGAVSADADTGIRDLWRLAGVLRRIDEGALVALPTTLTDAPIPFAELRPGAAAALDRVGRGGPCGEGALLAGPD
ncbi:MAG TPA: LCP family protein [Acidimicrobiia bacterium]|nr:LCP family protein [Acidimicrobiia bacterium]